MWDTYTSNDTTLYSQYNTYSTYLQCEILTLLTILHSQYNTYSTYSLNVSQFKRSWTLLGGILTQLLLSFMTVQLEVTCNNLFLVVLAYDNYVFILYVLISSRCRPQRLLLSCCYKVHYMPNMFDTLGWNNHWIISVPFGYQLLEFYVASSF